MTLVKKNPILIIGGVIGIAVVAWLAFGFFGIQSAFIDREVSEGGPVFDSDEFNAAMDEAEQNQNSVTEPVEDVMPGDISTLYSADFAGVSRYTITGQALVLTDGSDQRFLRFDEDFSTNNGPDLKVYLRAENGDFVSLGDLRGNIGDQNYEIPVGTDLSVFSEVQIWCERFSINFGGAFLEATAA